jgi:hypothetical protein
MTTEVVLTRDPCPRTELTVLTVCSVVARIRIILSAEGGSRPKRRFAGSCPERQNRSSVAADPRLTRLRTFYAKRLCDYGFVTGVNPAAIIR